MHIICVMANNPSHNANRSKSRGFLRRHNRLLSFVGVLIVFITFVVKEGLRERIKDLADSIGTAQNLFLLRNDGTVTARQVESLQAQLAQLEARQDKEAPWVPSTMYLTTITSRAYGAKRCADSIATFVSALPKHAAYDKRLKELDDEQQDLKVAVAVAVATDVTPLAAQLGIGAVPTGDQAERRAEAERQINELNTLSWKVFTDGQNLADDVLRDAEGVKKKREDYYAIYTWASFALYSLGWSLGLIGRLYGKEDFASEV